MNSPTYDEHSATRSRAPRRFGTVVAGVAAVALVLGVGIGIAVGGPLLGRGAQEVSAEGDLRTACRYAAEIGDVEEDDIEVAGPLLWRLQATASLVVASGYADGGDAATEEAGMAVFVAVQRLDLEALDGALEELHTICD